LHFPFEEILFALARVFLGNGNSECSDLYGIFLRVGGSGLWKEKAEIVRLNCRLEVGTSSSDILAEDTLRGLIFPTLLKALDLSTQ